ncbi:MAG: hypothetical protein ABI321_23600 [Polyangia bacterium]
MPRLIALLAILLVVLPGSPAWAADPTKRPFLVDRGSVEVLIGEGGWRSGLSTEDVNPGFSVLGGGGELVVGLDFIPGFGVIIDGKVLAAPRRGGTYVEGVGALGLQLRISDWVRLRGGAAAGRARLDRNGQPTDTATLVGGFFAVSIDLFRLLHDRASTVISFRVDADGHLDAGSTFSKESLALTLGVGFRF